MMVVGIIPEITPDFCRVRKWSKEINSLGMTLKLLVSIPQRSSAKSRLLLSGEAKRRNEVTFQHWFSAAMEPKVFYRDLKLIINSSHS